MWESNSYHGVQVGEPINKSRGFGEALLERIAEIVGRVGGDDENRGANPGEKNGENGATGGLAHAAFASDEDPLQTLLPQYVLHGPFR